MSNQIQNKLSAFQVKPPDEVWNKIAEALDTDADYILSKKLFNYQQTPSAQAWDNIKTRLEKINNKVDPARVVPFFKRYRIPLKYTAAAASFIFVAVLVSLMVSKKSVSETTASTASQQQNSFAAVKNDTQKTTAFPGKNTQKNKLFSPPENKKLIKAFEQQPAVNSSRYIVYANTSGNAVKVSKKLYSLFACYDSKPDCRQNIEGLQQKVAASAVMASADFTSVLDLLKTIETNK
jgi:hypothetical protein